MVKIKPKVVIDNLAKAQLKEAYTYIKLDSPKNAEIVKAKILASPHFAPFVSEQFVPIANFRKPAHWKRAYSSARPLMKVKRSPRLAQN
jgi:hypothetical protein